MSNELYPTKPEWQKQALIKPKDRVRILEESLSNPDVFWQQCARRLHWYKDFDRVSDVSYERPVRVSWYVGGELNASYNAIDRHVEAGHGDRIAYTWVPENPDEKVNKISYKALLENVCRLANALKANGVKRGDRVTIYMPMILEATYALLACARIGAVHSVIFGGFSPTALADRIRDCQSQFIITADEGLRGGRTIPLKKNVDEACKLIDGVRHVLVVKRTGKDVDWVKGRDIWYHEATEKAATTCVPEKMKSDDPLFILYTSGSTGKPKGVLHTTGGYLVYASLTHEMVFDYHKDDVYWCAADVGWVTGHSYIVYGPLCNGATSILYEGLPTYPTASRLWQIIDEHKVNILYTAPTLIRALMREGPEWVQKTSRKSLRILGSVGEPINPEAWLWYYKIVGDERCPIVDTWWQTETGGILISPLPGATDLKPGSASFPLFGIKPVLLKDNGEEIRGEGTGHLCLTASWPGQMCTVYQDHKRFEETYFSQFPGKYYTGDECHRDKDGYYWIIGRADDVINVSGHRLGTAEVESALVSHKSVAESAVVGYPHPIKGQGIYAFVTLKNGITATEDLKKDLVQHVRTNIGAIASPDLIQWAPGLPKTRSGKIMRRILKKIAANDFNELGDISTLAEPAVVENLVAGRINR
jgi:acetyl-CoA synthetase